MSIRSDDKAWLEGVKAFIASSQSRDDNPYSKGGMPDDVRHSVQWFSGWDTASLIIGFHKVKEAA